MTDVELRRRTHLSTLWMLLISLCFASGAAWRQHRHNTTLVHERFSVHAQQLADRLLNRMQIYEYGLRAARGTVIVTGTAGLSRRAFRDYARSRDLSTEFPGAHSFGVVRRVPTDDEAAFVAAAQRDDWPDFRIWQLSPQPGERWVVTYVEPSPPNRRAVGLDIASEARRQQAAADSLRTGRATLTAPLSLVDATDRDEDSFVMLLPVYRPGLAVGTAEQRVRAGEGWTYLTLRTRELFHELEQAHQALVFSVADLDGQRGEFRFFRSAPPPATLVPDLDERIVRSVYGRRWALDVRARQQFVDELQLLSARAVLALGVFTAGLLTLLAYAYALSRERGLRDLDNRQIAARQLQHFAVQLEQQVGERTEQLEGARRNLQTVLDALPSLVGYCDKTLVLRFANLAFRRWYGDEDSSLIGRHVRELIGDERLERNRPLFEATLRGEPQTFERTLVRPDGKGQGQFLAHYIPDLVEGEARGVYLLAHDVTELTESRQKLAASEAFLERAGRVAGVGGWQLELSTGARTWTAETRRILEVDADYYPDQDTEVVFAPDETRATLEQLMLRAVETGEGWDIELPFTTAKGRAIWVRSVGELERERENGRPARLIGAIQDVSERRAADAALREATAEAQAANAAKTEFLANMSHEIRTPMNAVIGLAHLLEHTPLNELQRSYLAKMQLASRALLGVINDVLDVSKIEAGELTLEDTTFDLGSLLYDLEQLMAPAAEQKSLTLIIDRVPERHRWLQGDPTRLQQLLVNLLSNAIKFTERGRVVLNVAFSELGSDRISLRCAVTDTGIGIAQEVQQRLFSAFTQVDASTTRRFGGTGLGLSIVKRLAHLMGGEVGLKSELGQGSEFWVVLPLRSAPEARVGRETVSLPMAKAFALADEGHDADARPLLGARVLVVDDSDVNVEIVQWILERAGALVSACHTGQQALTRLRAGPHDFDVVLMDVQMPEMDGNETTRRLRSELGLGELPVIALTAGTLVAERSRSLAAGMNDFIGKPLDPQLLIRTVRRYVEARGGGWPVLDGIDTARASELLGSDFSLFSSLLRGLSREFQDLTRHDPSRHADAARRMRLARRLHKLRGSAGTLGALVVEQLAGRAEALLSAEAPGSDLEPTLHALALALARLERDVAQLDSAAARSRADEARASTPGSRAQEAPPGTEHLDTQVGAAPAFSRAELDALRALLLHNDLAALRSFQLLASRLEAALGRARFEQLRESLNRLDFARAAALLPHASEAVAPRSA